MVPKKIHFCWLSGEEYPPLIKNCLDTWKRVLPDYEIILWDTKRFDINSVSWVKEAFEAKKYAFAADYIRFFAIYTEGGIYLDSDVEMLKTFNPLLNHKSFVGFEAATEEVEAAIIGGEKGNEWCKKALEFYTDRHFTLNEIGNINPQYIAPIVLKNALSSLYDDFPQTPPSRELNVCNGALIVCPSEYFSPIKYEKDKSYSSGKEIGKDYRKNKETYCIHRFNGAWASTPSRKLLMYEYLRKQLYKIIGKDIAEKILSIRRNILK